MKRVNWRMVVVFWTLTVAVDAQAAKATAAPSGSGRAQIGVRSADPYLGAIVVDARTGKVIFEDKADEPGYPASVVKLMDMLLIEERIDARTLALTNLVYVTAESSKIGGSQVFLAEKEVFPVEELVAAMAIHSANDAAVALAVHVAGTRPAFVDLMNRRAAELGMRATRFHSVHGLPPAQGQEPDVSTARDLAILAREVLKHPDVTRYTSQPNRPFRNGTFGLRNPNHLLGVFPGCDGLKTGYFRAGGFSIVATAQRDGRRAIAVVLGAVDRDVRDATAKDLLAKGLLAAEPPPPPPPPVPVVTNAAPVAPGGDSSDAARGGRRWGVILGAAAVVVVLGVGVFRMRRLRTASER